MNKIKSQIVKKLNTLIFCPLSRNKMLYLPFSPPCLVVPEIIVLIRAAVNHLHTLPSVVKLISVGFRETDMYQHSYFTKSK